MLDRCRLGIWEALPVGSHVVDDGNLESVAPVCIISALDLFPGERVYLLALIVGPSRIVSMVITWPLKTHIPGNWPW